MMRELIENSAFLGVVITIGSFELGRAIRKKWNFALFNPLLLAILFSIGVLLLFRIDYGSYLNGAKYINFLLTPATVCLAVPLYEKFELLKKNADALKTATVETAKESERGIVDMETLKHTNESLISTLDEVMRIQDEGRQKRREAEAEIGRIEGELKQKLLQLHN